MMSTDNHESGRTSAFRSITSTTKTQPPKTRLQSNSPISEYFGELTFGLGQMRERLAQTAYQDVIKCLEQGKKLSKESADAIAQVVKEWAVSKGCTHFSHWFQPMTGLTAEKHDSFISVQHSYYSELRVVERFTGGQLIQGEPDASSFPSGGMRTTFEARGYTAWDPSSPLFIIEGETGKTLCIPTVFFGYHGQALDLKTPMLRSVQALNSAATTFLKALGDVDVKRVNSTLGPEQEYFLIDRRFAALRPDLLLTGRTLLGAPSSRHQQLEDHYFGSIPERAKTFMEDLETESYKLGIPVKTRHNEVAPSQFELAPIFEDASIGADHNSLLMETMKRVSNRHGLMCLLHEKPFAGINGTGKHCNWSLMNDKGENLLEPGNTPHQNLRFLAMTAVVLKAVHEHADVLRASIASPGNDHRLGGNEAPPAIISVFLGSHLSKICDDIEAGKASQATESQIINLGISHLPTISKDSTDRNRTSPFAFTGNKFEFRAVGGSANVAVPMSVLNAAVADVLTEATEKLKSLFDKKANRDESVMELVRDYLKESRNIRFEGNNYSQEWQQEAKKRGLPILPTTVEALKVYENEKAVEFLIRTKVLNKEEIHSRYHVAVERYNKTLLIEHQTLWDLVQTQICPAIESQLIQSNSALGALSGETKKLQEKRIHSLSDIYAKVLTELEGVSKLLDKTGSAKDEAELMEFIASKITPRANLLRKACDEAETQVSDSLWPLPKYREMLFAHGIS